MTHGAPPWALIVGGGPCGCELAWGLAVGGVPTLLVTTSLDTIANLPGDAWGFEPPPGGLLERLAPEARSGDGSWRSAALHRGAKRELERVRDLHVLQSSVSGLLVDRERVVGVRTWEGVDRRASRVALCVGTFLGARLSTGTLIERAGRLSEMAYDDLYDDLAAYGLPFHEAVARLDGDGVTPGYEVAHHVIAPDVLEADGAILSLPGAWAFGACARPNPDLGAAARSGAEAAAVWRSAWREEGAA